MVSGQSVITDSNSSRVNTTSSMVARRVDSLGRSSPSSAATIFVSYDGCDQRRVGCSSGTTQSDSFGVVVSSGVTSTYQQYRNANGLSSCISFPVTSSRLLCMVSTDNTSVVTYIQAQGGTRSHSLYLETKWCLD
ncbi:hypothetical protein DPMN_040606 [Dreissena polymorpha]|uniref:Uncharacterized protein n=1 Tax=Dreissena polymorpha TaxID=45954 RepID=A0A9D4CY31_DREPO|nr:hypothetical protein DPMN_040606 [Dreissena polymorpha]